MRANVLCAFTCAVALMACNDDSDSSGSNNSATFSTSAETVSEGDGTITITVNTKNAVSEESLLYFDLSGTASLNGDYTLVTESPITIPADSSYAEIEIALIDESIIEEDETLVITLSASSSEIDLSESDESYTLTIEDNDEAPDSGIQVDLTWGNEAGEDIDAYNLDLYILMNVEIDGSSVTDYDYYSYSLNDSGFETAWLTEDADDGDYYIAVSYYDGTEDIAYTITVNGADYDMSEIDGEFESDEVGYAYIYGPITKDGTSFARQASGTAKQSSTMKVYKITHLKE